MVSLVCSFFACSAVNLVALAAAGVSTAGPVMDPADSSMTAVTAGKTEGGDKEGAGDMASRKVHPRLVAEHGRLVAGETNTLAIIFEIEPHWHMYWPGVNDTGIPASAEFTLPEGFTEREWQWPAPFKRQVLPGEIIDHIYEGTLTVLVPVDVPADTQPGPVTISGELSWLVCNDSCILEHASVRQTIEVVKGDQSESHQRSKLEESDDELIRKARGRVPTDLPDTDAGVSPDGFVRYQVIPDAGEERGEGRKLAINTEDAMFIAFYPQEGCLPIDNRVDGSIGYTHSIDIHFNAPTRLLQQETDVPPGVRGVIEVRLLDVSEPRFYRIARPFSSSAEKAIPSSHTPSIQKR